MKKLLCIVGNMNAGGAETFLMKMYRKFDKSKYQMDFCVASIQEGFYEKEILDLGGKIYRITPKIKNPIKNFLDIKNIVKNNDYKYVLRVSQHSLSTLELLAARLGGAKKIAFRSSNTNPGNSKLSLLIHYVFRPFANLITNVKIAPSTEAALFMFGKRVVKNKKFYLLNNGLEIKDYEYSEENRKKIRKELGLKNEFLIGHIGRFSKQKNHKFLLDIFKEFLKKNSNSLLLLIGIGELENEIKDYAKELNIYNKIIFYGPSNKTSQIYSAIDYLVFPSLYEGMPNVVIEAQASGLECLVSDTITKECNLTNKVKFKSLQDSPKEWSKEIKLEKSNRSDVVKFLYDNHYNIDDVVLTFEKIIFND